MNFTLGSRWFMSLISNTTGVACVNLNRKFIGIELDDKYFEIGKNRVLATQQGEIID